MHFATKKLLWAMLDIYSVKDMVESILLWAFGPFYKVYKEHKGLLGRVLIAFAIIVIGIPFLLTRTWGYECLKYTSSTGVIGDTLGGITAPFIGFLNIVLLIWTLYKQIEFNKKQLLAQKNEQFKAAFFQMLQTQRELLHEIKGTFLSRNMKGEVNAGKIMGFDYFRCAGMELKTLFDVLDGKIKNNELIFQNVKEKYGIKEDEIKQFNDVNNEQQMKFVYSKFIDVHIEMKNYFRHLYHILRIISKEKNEELEELKDVFNKDEKKAEEKRIEGIYKGYADLLQATLSEEELKMAYYNSSAFDKTRKLFLEFGFVENLSVDKLIRKEKDVMTEFKFK